MTSKKYCPISYELLTGNQKYHPMALKKLSPNLKEFCDLSLTAEELRLEATRHADKLSIQGVQPKLSAVIDMKIRSFKWVDHGGRFILKPPHASYLQLPENEDLTMRLARQVGIDVPFHGMVYALDGSLTYFIKRFDRMPRGKKIAVEDFAQLLNQDRETKYNLSMEQVLKVIDAYCTFPLIDKKKLLIRMLFNYLIGNEDMHLKNYSLIMRDEKVSLAPAYDFINTTLVLKNAKEEIALPLNGKKSNLTYKDFIQYYAKDKCQLNEATINEILSSFEQAFLKWQKLIEKSFLTEERKEQYWDLICQRKQKLKL